MTRWKENPLFDASAAVVFIKPDCVAIKLHRHILDLCIRMCSEPGHYIAAAAAQLVLLSRFRLYDYGMMMGWGFQCNCAFNIPTAHR